MQKRGQIQLSFGMIFSIIIIIVTIAIAVYVIVYFVNLGKCTNVALFYDEFENRIDESWNSQITSGTYEGKVSSGVEQVCFGLLQGSVDDKSKEAFEVLRRYRNEEANVFLYPIKHLCRNSVPYRNIEHMKTENFFCVDVKDGKVTIKISKETGDSLVLVSGTK